MSRRNLLRGVAAGAGAVTLPALLSACGEGPGGDGNTVTMGSNASDPVPKKAYAAAFQRYEKKTGKTVKVNTKDHNDFQENINRYLQGRPDDVFMWFAGYRMQYFAEKGLLTEISDVWQDFKGFSPAFKDQATYDGKQYFVPYYYYPWAVFHRKSLFEERGYEQAKTWDEFIALAKKMHGDGIPVAFSDKDGWPAMGTFDYINMRANGYDFHKSLMAGEEAWTSPKVKNVFDLWRELMPYYQKGALGRTWQEAAQGLQKRTAGMAVFGMPHPGQQFPESERDDIDLFAFPEIDPQYGQDAVEAPIDGFLIAKKSKNVDAAKDLLKFLGTPEAEELYLSVDPNNVAVNEGADTSKYSALQKKSVDLMANAKQISQFMDRDTRPDFSSTVMIKAIQDFIANPNDVDGLVNGIERQKKTIFSQPVG
ncbi:carbohydrate ABC transporter substrate-binding protein [Streptomyces sp. HC44]|uniref:Carbohydrate ABC transporter substrate-binding protein n=1 Tax=Streptomyces scabichelini TaxID=2711217 RepID=A0A6G4UWY9_9ACTN|nr:ABC transporter substrate-binding protein [Streptomyces scabichelini]NGO06185.1 carbohydrate ABC transporter substrate-binding protein [Streptomyces scabichelini]